MFCAKCGKSIHEGSNFCPFCGEDILNSHTGKKLRADAQEISKKKLMLDEYIEKMDIKSVEEARRYLKKLNILFWTVFGSFIVIRIINVSLTEDFAAVFFLLWSLYVILLIYFIYYCYKILKKERLSGLNAVLCVALAPLSWLILYPAITTPLKIIIGEKELPSLKNEGKELINNQSIEKKSNNPLKGMMIFLALGVLALVIVVVCAYIFSFQG